MLPLPASLVKSFPREHEAIMRHRRHLARLQGELRSLLPTDWSSCLLKMKKEIHLAVEARNAPGLCSRRVSR